MTVEEKAKKYADDVAFLVPYDGTMNFYDEKRLKTAKIDYLAGHNEAMRWRDPKIELPESNAMVQIEYSHTMRKGNSYSHDRYDPKEQTWNIEEIDSEVKVLYWRPIK